MSEYIPFGEEWEREMMKHTKKELIEFIRKNKKDVLEETRNSRLDMLEH